MWITKNHKSAVEEVVDEIFYLDWSTSQRYNARRDKDQPMILGGWYWAVGAQEGGPFKSKTAAYVNAYYLLVLRRSPPLLKASAKKRGSLQLVRVA